MIETVPRDATVVSRCTLRKLLLRAQARRTGSCCRARLADSTSCSSTAVKVVDPASRFSSLSFGHGSRNACGISPSGDSLPADNGEVITLDLKPYGHCLLRHDLHRLLEHLSQSVHPDAVPAWRQLLREFARLPRSQHLARCICDPSVRNSLPGLRNHWDSLLRVPPTLIDAPRAFPAAQPARRRRSPTSTARSRLLPTRSSIAPFDPRNSP